jgi:predicted transcriptional regulator
VSDPLPELKKHLLERLKAAKGQKLIASKFTAYKQVCRRLSANDADVRAAKEQLVQQGHVTEQKGAYRLTPTGEEHLQSLEPAPPETNPKLFSYQQAFVLLKFFLAEEQTLTQAKLEQQLRTQDAVRYLEFGSLPAEAKANARPEADTPLIGWVLKSLVGRGALERRPAGNTVKYRLTEDGEDLLGASEQYPGIPFRLTGKEFSKLIETIQRSSARLARGEAPASAQTTAAHPPPEHRPVPPPLTAAAVLREIDELLREKHSRTGMVPIHELRRAVAAKYGPEASRHENLDPLLKQLRRDGRARLIAIGDRSRVTPEQLDDSIPGENETFFYVEAAHEHATVG